MNCCSFTKKSSLAIKKKKSEAEAFSEKIGLLYSKSRSQQGFNTSVNICPDVSSELLKHLKKSLDTNASSQIGLSFEEIEMLSSRSKSQ